LLQPYWSDSFGRSNWQSYFTAICRVSFIFGIMIALYGTKYFCLKFNEFHGNHAFKSTSVVVNGNDELLVPLDPNIYWDAPTEFIFHDLGMCYN